MNVLFIGGTGNISRDCVDFLLNRGDTVFAVTRGNRPVPERCTPLRADRYDAAALREAVGGIRPDTVINFLGFKIPEIEIDCEIFAGRISQYIYISSATVYAKPHRQLPLTENSPLGNPYSPYAQNKQMCEELLLDKYREKGFPVTIVRPSHTYSNQWMPNPISSADYTLASRMERSLPILVHGDGQSLWTLTATSDFAAGLGGLVGMERAVGEVFHITSDEVLTWNQILIETASALGVGNPDLVHVPVDVICAACPVMTPKLKGDKAENAVFDNAKIKRFVPDFQCRKSFRSGIAESVEWFNTEPSRKKVSADVEKIYEDVLHSWQVLKGKN